MKEKLNNFVGHLLTLLMATMLVSVLWQVGTRYLLHNPSSFTDELARYLLIWIGTLGAAFVSGKKMHLAIDLLPKRLAGRSKYWLLVFINVLIVAFSLGVLVIGGSHLVYVTYTLGQTSAALQIPLAYVYTILPASGLLIIYYKIDDIINLNTELDPGTPSIN